MIPAKYAFTCPKGSTFDKTLTLTNAGAPYDFTSYTAEMQIRDSKTNTLIISLTNGSGITLGGALGTIRALISSTVTAGLATGTYVYDVYIKSAGAQVDYILGGTFTITATVSV